MKALTEEKTREIQRRARFVARKYNFPQLAEDFAQEVFITLLEQPERGATIDQIFIDYLRRTYGRPGTPGGDARIKAELSLLSIDDARNIAADPEEHYEPGGFAHLFRGREAEIYNWYFVEEFTEWRIAEFLGITESRVCQILGGMKKKIRKEVEYEEVTERYQPEETFGIFEVEWIRI